MQNELVNALRQELEQYGETLVFFDALQNRRMPRPGGDPFDLADDIRRQEEMLKQLRLKRGEAQRTLALSLGLAPDASLRQILQGLPGPYRLLVNALIEENQRLWAQIQHRADQAREVMWRAAKVMESCFCDA